MQHVHFARFTVPAIGDYNRWCQRSHYSWQFHSNAACGIWKFNLHLVLIVDLPSLHTLVFGAVNWDHAVDLQLKSTVWMSVSKRPAWTNRCGYSQRCIDLRQADECHEYVSRRMVSRITQIATDLHEGFILSKTEGCVFRGYSWFFIYSILYQNTFYLSSILLCLLEYFVNKHKIFTLQVLLWEYR